MRQTTYRPVRLAFCSAAVMAIAAVGPVVRPATSTRPADGNTDRSRPVSACAPPSRSKAWRGPSSGTPRTWRSIRLDVSGTALGEAAERPIPQPSAGFQKSYSLLAAIRSPGVSSRNGKWVLDVRRFLDGSMTLHVTATREP